MPTAGHAVTIAHINFQQLCSCAQDRAGENPSTNRGGALKAQPLVHMLWQLMAAELGRVIVLWRCGHWQTVHASVDGHKLMCIRAAVTALRGLLIRKANRKYLKL